MKKLQEMSSHEGYGSQQLTRSFNIGGDDKLVDKYNLEEDTNALKEKLFANNDEDDVNPQNDFLKIAKGAADMESYKEEKPLTADEVKFKVEGEQTEKRSEAPMIKELSSTTFSQS
jgi:hypothetical protein